MSTINPRLTTSGKPITPESLRQLCSPESSLWLSAESILFNENKARSYYMLRETDARRMVAELKWTSGSLPMTLEADLYGNKLVHELRACTLHADACWGELFIKGQTDPIMFETFETFIGYVLAKWW